MQGPSAERREGRQGLWALASGALLAAAAFASGLLGWATLALEDHAMAHTAVAVPSVATVVDWGPAPVLPEAHARLLQRLTEAGARQVLYLAALPAAQNPPPPANGLATDVAGGSPGSALTLEQALQRSGVTWLRIETSSAGASSSGAQPLSALQRRSVLPDPGALAPHAPALKYPDDAWLAASAGAAPWVVPADGDGRVRSVPLLFRHDSTGIPSLALVAALGHWHLGLRDVRRVETPAELHLGGVKLPVDAQGQLRPVWAEPSQAVSARAVMDGAVDRRLLEDRTIIVTATRFGAASAPIILADGRPVSEAEALAQVVSAMRHAAVVSIPSWARGVSGLAVMVAAVVLLCWPRLLARSASAAWACLGLLTVLGVGAPWLAFQQAAWSFPAALAMPLMLLGGASGALVWGALDGLLKGAYDFRDRRSGARQPDDGERMLGLVRQGQGDWRGALQHYQRAPVTPALLDNLLQLALDLERQQRWPQAKQVYEFLLRRDRHHREGRKRYQALRARLKEEAGRVPGTSGEAVPAAAPLPTQIGPYRVDALLGQGAMGAVYRAHDAQIGRPIALKTLALAREFEGVSLEEARARFFREAKAAGRLLHPGIVTVFGAGEEQGLAYIAMEYLPGSDLAARAVPGHLLPTDQVIALGVEVALALDYAHEHQVVHRDIKPANLRWNPDTGQVKIVDFGVARLTDALRTRTGLVLGTPSFMSPEQVQGARVDGRSDLYALGVTLFQLLTGRLPLRGDSLPQLLQAIVSQPAPDVRELRPELPEPLARVLSQALAKSPEARFQTGRAMAEALKAVIGSVQPISGDADSATVDYDQHGATGCDGSADFQETVMESRYADRGTHHTSLTGAP
ncbi:MAG: protein kinase domain-containing protein [Burkholderiaceae bacterium]